MNTEHNWERLYQAAILETDWSKLEGHIQAAERGIKARLHEFSMNHGGTPEENRAIEDALRGLRFLRKDLTAWQSKAIDRIKSS
jgi:hypothetical protein